MALVQILVDKLTGNHRGTTFSLKDTKVLEKSPIFDFTVDATLTENHSFESEVTENPVEEGVSIADHINLKPETYSLTGVISDTPLDLTASVKGAFTSGGALAGKSIVGPLGAYAGVGAGAFANLASGGSGNRMKNAFDHLRNLQSARVPFTVITGLSVYENMVLTSLTINRDNKSGRSFNFSATLKKIRIVKSQVVDIKNVPRNVTGASKQSDLGKQSTEVASIDKKTLFLKAKNFLVDGAKNFLSGGSK